MAARPSSLGLFRSFLSATLFLAGFLYGGAAGAQQKTFHLDRLEVPGAPDDGVAVFRPTTEQRNIVFGQIGLGYQLRPLRTSNVTTVDSVLDRSRSAVIQDQFAVYANAGFQLLDRMTFGIAFPWYPIQTGGNPNYSSGSIQGPGQTSTTTVNTGGPGAGDIRLDIRGTIVRSDDRKSALGGQIHIFAPTGTTTNFGGDGGTAAMLMFTGEHTIKWITLVANTGFHFKPRHSINSPNDGSGLGIGNEWRWAIGAFVPFKEGKFRLGANILGQTGIESDRVIGDTFFTGRNTPLELDVEGRMRFGARDHWWVGALGGTAIARGYGAPDLRVVALLGTYFTIDDSDPKSPDRKANLRAKWRREHASDRDNDGIPDDIDACPDEPEDHQGNDPNDGCPMPKDRDGDGIPDQFDKCPDTPEDKDGVQDADGCPEDDADNDGIPDVQDACPKEVGSKNSDPKKNGCPSFIKVEGNVVRILQQVHFATGSTTILPESFPMLQEIANLLKANQAIKKMSINGHTDNRGGADLNKKLSQGRADSVMKWLTQHGVEGGRLEAHGWGLEQPIEDNNADAGRAANRRVEFKIVEEDDGSGKPKK